MGHRSRWVHKAIVAVGTIALVAVMAAFAFAAAPNRSASSNGYGYTPPCGYSCSSTGSSTGSSTTGSSGSSTTGSTTGTTGSVGGSSTTQCKVPNLVNKKKTVIRTKLAAAHCTLGKLIKRYNSAKRGLVIKVNPAAGTRHRAGHKVDVTVSLGPKPKPKH